MKKTAIITVAGISSRFNEGIEEKNKVLKCIYTEKGYEESLLYHLIKKCLFADQIILVGGYLYNDLCFFYEKYLASTFSNVCLVENDRYADLNSGYSLYLGIKTAQEYKPDEIVFVEGDLDVDQASFEKVISSPKNVLTYSCEPIYASKAVVLYRDKNEHYKYQFDSHHGMLMLHEAFSCIFNSGQIWKFSDSARLYYAAEKFIEEDESGTNLQIIQNYIDSCDSASFDLIGFKRWTNCNTRLDYKNIVRCWENEK